MVSFYKKQNLCLPVNLTKDGKLNLTLFSLCYAKSYLEFKLYLILLFIKLQQNFEIEIKTVLIQRIKIIHVRFLMYLIAARKFEQKVAKFWKLQRACSKAILKSQKTYIKDH